MYPSKHASHSFLFASVSGGCQVATTGSVHTKNCAKTLPMRRNFYWLIRIVTMPVTIMTAYLSSLSELVLMMLEMSDVFTFFIALSLFLSSAFANPLGNSYSAAASHRGIVT